MDKFFIIVSMNPCRPIVDEEDEMVFYESEDAAVEAMVDHMTAIAYGFEVYEIGAGSMYQGVYSNHE